MHGYDLNRIPVLHSHQQQQQDSLSIPLGKHINGPPISSGIDSGLISHHHPDSADSFVTYLESDDSTLGSP